MSEAKLYQCHKQVLAIPMSRQEYNDYRGWELPTDENGSDEGFLIEYLDGGESNHPNHEGYISWSRKNVFERGYTSTEDGFSFGTALQLLEAGQKVARKGWNGKGMWLIYNPASNGQTHAMADGSVYKNHGVDNVEILPHIDMYTVNSNGRRAMLAGWLASQTDMISKDWVLVK